MSEAAQTLEGWFALHDFRSIDWIMWKNATPEQRKEAEDELLAFLDKCTDAERQKQGSTAFYSIVGQ
jgi:peroxiredoxin